MGELKDIFCAKSENSIENIILNIAWYDSIYRTFNAGLRLAWKRERLQSLPHTLVEYIHLSHVHYIMINIRKLYEPKRKGPRKVNSLPTLISLIGANIGLFSRENYVCFDGNTL